MNHSNREFNHFVENIHEETGWHVQYAQYDQVRRIVWECARSTPFDFTGHTPPMQSSVDSINSQQWSVDLYPYWQQVCCEGRSITVPAREYVMKNYPSSDVPLESPETSNPTYISLTPVTVREQVRGAIAVFAPNPFSRPDEEKLRRYAREAQALERVTELEARTGEQAAALTSMIRDTTRLQDQTAQAIAEHLHGKVQSHLLVAWHRLQQCQELLYDNPKQVRELLDTTMEILDTVRDQQIRQLSHALHPALIRVALVPAIKKLLARFSDPLVTRLSIGPELVQGDSPINGSIPLESRLALYRILEEALGNLVRHSSATLVDVTLLLKPDTTIALEVTDNGEPWNVDPSPPHMGLMIMSIRAQESGGELSFTRTEGLNHMTFTVPTRASKTLSHTSSLSIAGCSQTLECLGSQWADG